ncbi:hypothetical protein P4493_32665 [Bacillus thuringiensis]|uniref:Uncharacterized protein n=3 Tax=Bacillus thuringiensis TaxID=1428 RepID=A0AB35PLY2_BACTU|nr:MULTISPECIES: hypothetical protein [Bacillus]MED1157935.1 hypothetical protein [Bacillus paranthracis]AFQ30508.1 hypothetical protein BTF1_32116 [Bacillus thuringiensis HD-789]AND28730.1 hypothetical protein ATN07_34025 [Bacillus thuringiensis serovar israelensis]ASO64492.1 hypothetical protein [Bacillus thuringiensis serovar israelensis]EEM99031.1 hypothetical protein bthur0014_63670 [Bacillus thuringiensis IBL 4222]
MKENINLNSVVFNTLKQYEQAFTIMTFRFTKIDEDFYYTYIDPALVDNMQLSKKHFINRRLQDICINREIFNKMYTYYELAWKNEQSNLYIFNLNTHIYIIYFKKIYVEKEKEVVQGHCIPINPNSELLSALDIPIVHRFDFI